MKKLFFLSFLLSVFLFACKKETIITKEDFYSGLDSLPYKYFNYSACNNKAGQFIIHSLQDFYIVDSICNLTGNYSLSFDSSTYIGVAITLNHLGYNTDIKIYKNPSENKIIVRLIANERYEMVTPNYNNQWYWVEIPKVENGFSFEFIREYNLFNNQ